MPSKEIFSEIKKAIDSAQRNDRTAEIHFQMLRFLSLSSHNNISGKEFCEEVSLPPSYEIEFNKMKKLFKRLQQENIHLNK